MTKTTPAQQTLGAVLQPGLKSFEDGLADLRNKAAAYLRQLDDSIAAKFAEQQQLQRNSVPRQAFIDRVTNEVMQSGRAAAEAGHVYASAAAASRLSAHGVIRATAGTNAQGIPEYVSKHDHRLDILAHDTPALALVGMLPSLFEPAIRAWAGSIADEHNLPAEGNVADLLAQHERLQDEIEELAGQRFEATARLSELAREKNIAPFRPAVKVAK